MSLEALPFADPDPTLSFKWIKSGKKALSCKDKLTVEKVTQAQCKGFYTCEISKDSKPYFSVYYCLKATSKLADLEYELYSDSTLFPQRCYIRLR